MFKSKLLWIILVLVVSTTLVAFFKINHYKELDRNSDFHQYLETARYFANDSYVDFFPQQILKPLPPLSLTILHPFIGSYEDSFLFEVIFFYLSLVVVAFFFFYEFFGRRLEPALIGAILLVFSYPVMRYGLAFYTDCGAWLLYLSALYFVIRFIRRPELRFVFFSASISAIAFLWKEYAVVSFLILFTSILFHPTLIKKDKIKFCLVAGGIFTLLNIPWQIFVLLTYQYNYFDWYGVGGLPGFQTEFTFFNLLKTTFALIMGAWFLLPFGLRRFFSLNQAEKRFLIASLIFPSIVLAWGFVSSRLFYVFAPPLLILSILGLESSVKNKWLRFTIVFVLLSLNVAWLIFSYR